MQVGDQKLIADWLSKTGQELTCPAVKLPISSQFAVIINSQVFSIHLILFQHHANAFMVADCFSQMHFVMLN